MKVLGISGSPVRESNLDRLIQTVLGSSGLEQDFIKLALLNFRPCRACLKCADANRCVHKDDWQKIETRMLEADAIVIGAYTTYNTIDAWTKTLFERMFSFRHQRNILKGKIGVAVGMGYKCEELGYPGRPSAELVADYIEAVLKGFGLHVIGKLAARGNPPCLSCGFGETCEYSNAIQIWGEEVRITPDKFSRIEDQQEIMAKAGELGIKVREALLEAGGSSQSNILQR